jgi:hypothetical protein
MKTRLMFCRIHKKMRYLLVIFILWPWEPSAQEALLQLPTLLNQGPRDYEDCILQNLRGVQSDLAASAIIQACENKFPDSQRSPLEARKQYRLLPAEDLGRFGGTLGEYRGNILQVWLHNGTTNWAVARVVLGLMYWDPQQMDYQTLRLSSSPLSAPAWVEPGFERIFEFQPLRPEMHFHLDRWWIEEAEGYWVGGPVPKDPSGSLNVSPEVQK